MHAALHMDGFLLLLYLCVFHIQVCVTVDANDRRHVRLHME